MKNFIFAIKIFFKILSNRAFSQDVAQALAQLQEPALPEEEAVSQEEPAVRSDAVTLLAALQREARFVDFIKESLTSYNDAQIGAAVRDVHKGCAKVLERIFAIQPVLEQPEGAELEIEDARALDTISLVGNVPGEPPYTGKIQHIGWQASKCELPQCTGKPETVNLIAAAEVEVQ